MTPLNAARTVKLTSTTSNQTTTVPPGFQTLTVYNAASNPVFLDFASTVAVPDSTWANNVGTMVVQPGTTQVFACKIDGGTLAYIAETAGGSLYLTVGHGV